MKELEGILASLSSARSVLESRSDEIIVPLGGGVMVKVKPEWSSVLVSVGANVLVERDADKALEEIKKREEAVKREIEGLLERRRRIIENVRQAQAAARSKEESA